MFCVVDGDMAQLHTTVALHRSNSVERRARTGRARPRRREEMVSLECCYTGCGIVRSVVVVAIRY